MLGGSLEKKSSNKLQDQHPAGLGLSFIELLGRSVQFAKPGDPIPQQLSSPLAQQQRVSSQQR
jgi:hypothetical protein